MLCGGSIGLQADTVTLVTERSIALQGNTVPQVRGNAPQIPCFTMPLEFPAPPSLQNLAIARYRCGLRLVWHENPSLLFVPPRMKHYTRYCRSSCAANNFPPSVFPAELPTFNFSYARAGRLSTRIRPRSWRSFS